MTVRGVISRSPRLTLEEWLHYVTSRPDLVAPEPRVVENPFKRGAPTRWTPEPGDVRLVQNGVSVGGIAPSVEFDEDGELDVFYLDEHQSVVRAAVERLAKDLHAVVAWDDPD